VSNREESATNKNEQFEQVLLLALKDVRATARELEGLQSEMTADVQKADGSLEGENLKLAYSSVGNKYLPLFRAIADKGEKAKAELFSLKPPRKYRKKHVVLLQALKYMDDSVELQAQACRLLADGDVNGAVESLLAARPAMRNATEAISRF